MTSGTAGVYITLVGEEQHSGFKDLRDAEDYAMQRLDKNQTLVIGYFVSDAEGKNAQYYDRSAKAWNRTNLGILGAIKLANQTAA